MKGLLREYFSFRKSELRSTTAILIILTISLTVRMIAGRQQISRINQDPEILEQISELMHSPVEVRSPENNQIPEHENMLETKHPQLIKLKYFDPNVIGLHELISLGIRKETASNLIRYRDAGGVFRKPEDVRKIYGMTDSAFNRIKEYILIPQVVSTGSGYRETADELKGMESEKMMHNLNTVDTSGLKQIKGIGSVFSLRIVKYRKMLGGFHCHEQLYDIMGMDSIKFRTLCMYTFIDTCSLDKINLNTADEAELRSHPYIRSYYARSIIYYRRISGRINRIDELAENEILPPELYAKCRWYFSVNGEDGSDNK